MPSDAPQLRIPISEKTKVAIKVLASKQKISVAELIRRLTSDALAKEGIDIYDGVEAWGGDRRENKDHD